MIYELYFGGNNVIGKDWALSLSKRNSVIGQTIATNISRARAEVSTDTIKEYFKNLEKVLDNIQSENILDFDE